MRGEDSTYSTHFGQLHLSKDVHKNTRTEHEWRIHEQDICSRLLGLVPLGRSDVLQHSCEGHRNVKLDKGRTGTKISPTALPMALMIFLAFFLSSFRAARRVLALVRRVFERIGPLPSPVVSFYGAESAAKGTLLSTDLHEPPLSNHGGCWSASAAMGAYNHRPRKEGPQIDKTGRYGASLQVAGRP